MKVVVVEFGDLLEGNKWEKKEMLKRKWRFTGNDFMCDILK